jgi:hypothetical protein
MRHETVHSRFICCPNRHHAEWQQSLTLNDKHISQTAKPDIQNTLLYARLILCQTFILRVVI